MSVRSTKGNRKPRERSHWATRLSATISLLLVAFAMAGVQPVYSASVKPGAAHVPAYSCTVATEPSADGSAIQEEGISLGTALADFTGDHNPDVATLELQRLNASAAYYRLEIHLSEGGSQSLAIMAPARGLIVTPLDVTGDGTLDLVIQAAESGSPVAVFLNDGCGHFLPNAPERFPKAYRSVPGGRRFADADVRIPARDVAQSRCSVEFEIISRRFADAHVDLFSSREILTTTFRSLLSAADRAPPASA